MRMIRYRCIVFEVELLHGLLIKGHVQHIVGVWSVNAVKQFFVSLGVLRLGVVMLVEEVCQPVEKWLTALFVESE